MAELLELAQTSPRDAEQIRRARLVLDAAKEAEQPDARFVLQVSALHLARAVPEYWYTTADKIPLTLRKAGKEGKELTARLRSEFEAIFATARRYALLTELRSWDYHWEPLINPATVGAGCTYGRGAPMCLSTGPNPNSSVTLLSGNRVVTTGSGRRIGRKNYYQVRQSRFVDFEASEALPLGLAIRQFLEDLPACITTILQKPEVIEYLKAEA